MPVIPILSTIKWSLAVTALNQTTYLVVEWCIIIKWGWLMCEPASPSHFLRASSLFLRTRKIKNVKICKKIERKRKDM